MFAQVALIALAATCAQQPTPTLDEAVLERIEFVVAAWRTAEPGIAGFEARDVLRAAIADLDAVVARDRKNARALELRARCAEILAEDNRTAGDEAGAKGELRRAAEDYVWLATGVLMPPYEGRHRFYLSPEVREAVERAHAFLARALELDPDFPLANFASLEAAACCTLLAEDAANRGNGDAGKLHYDRAEIWCDAALTIENSYFFTWYARGMARFGLEHYESAVSDFDRAIELAAIPRTEDSAAEASDIRYRSLYRRAESLKRARRCEESIDAFRRYHTEYGTKTSFAWDHGYSSARVHLEVRDFASALKAYREIAALFPDEPATYAELGYVLGLLDGSTSAASDALRLAVIEKPHDLGSADGLRAFVYEVLWYVLLADSAKREQEALEILADLDRNSLPWAWERELVTFVLGLEKGVKGGETRLGDDALLAAAHAESERRIAENEPLNDLLSETWFYLGVRREHETKLARTPAEMELAHRGLTDALAAYRQCLAIGGRDFNWEREYARRRMRDVAHRLGRVPDAGFAVEDGSVVSVDPESLAYASGLEPGRINAFRIHRAGAALSAIGTDALASYTPGVGDLVQIEMVVAGVVQHADVVIGASQE